MDLELLRESLKDYARDIKLNLSSVLTEEGAPGLNAAQIGGIAMACAYKTGNRLLIESLIVTTAKIPGGAEAIQAAKTASTLMAMNNVYYRFTHLAEDKEFQKMPARLRMNALAKPGVAKTDFELMCLAVSAMAGCGACVNAHINEVKKAGLANEAVHSAVRIAATIAATDQALVVG